MDWCLDCILTCPELVCASSAEVRSLCVLLHGVQNRPRYLYLGPMFFHLGLMYLNFGPPDRWWVPKNTQETSKVGFGEILDPLRDALEAQNILKYNVFIQI